MKLQVWWIPQVPGKAFNIPVESVEEAHLLLDTLAAYDFFQLENRIKPDFCNMGGLNMWDEDSDGGGTPGWVDWEHPETYESFDEWRRDNLTDRFGAIKDASSMKMP